jgi:2-polyprenyl-3-methyl-5-hydroxy-6-metoxy-1,4-benzoquinol methylase/glycosyltransferase involved in cell wall biosynthesis
VPTFNERAEIKGRIDNLFESDYPRDLLSIIVVDSASSDGTADLARSVATGRGGHITVLEEPSRSGKASAVNLGLAAARTDLVVLTDAPTRFAPDALRIVARCLGDPSVGAATGYFRISAGDGALGEAEARFWRIRNRLRTMEAELDSTPFITGELCCFRRALVPALHTGTLADDMDVALQVRRRGYRVVIDNDAIFTEARTGVARKLLQTKSRRAAGGIQELFRGRDMLLRPRFGWYGMVVLPSAWSYYLPLRLPALGLMAYGLRRERAVPAMAAATMTLGAAAALIAPSARRQALAQLRMLVFNEAVFIAAWWRVLTGSMDVKWAQERSPAVGGYRLNDRRSAVNTHTLLVQYASGAPLVLDVGCSTGYLAGRLAERGATVDGIELDPKTAEKAREVCREVKVGSASDPVVWAGTTGRYNAVLLGDVIEHLVDPAATLSLAKAALAPGGRLVVSVPNVAEWRARARLGFGRFDYADTGVMDRTHMRWFTLATARELFAECGLREERFSGAAGGPTPPFLVRARPSLWAPQFVFDLRPI